MAERDYENPGEVVYVYSQGVGFYLDALSDSRCKVWVRERARTRGEEVRLKMDDRLVSSPTPPIVELEGHPHIRYLSRLPEGKVRVVRDCKGRFIAYIRYGRQQQHWQGLSCMRRISFRREPSRCSGGFSIGRYVVEADSISRVKSMRANYTTQVWLPYGAKVRDAASAYESMKGVKVLRVVGAGCVLGDDDELFSMDGPCGQHGNESSLFVEEEKEEKEEREDEEDWDE